MARRPARPGGRAALAAALAAAACAAAPAAVADAPGGATELHLLNHLDVPVQVTVAPARCGAAPARRVASGAALRLALRRGVDRCRIAIGIRGATRIVARCRAAGGGHRCRSHVARAGGPSATWSSWPVERRGFLTIAADRPLSARPCGPAGRPPLPVAWAMRRWMACTYARRPDVRLADAAIPGAHDAGAYDMTLERVRTCRSGTAQTVDALIDAGTWTEADSRAWSETQTASLREQLDLGTRYFDLRVDWQQLAADGTFSERYRFCHNANWAADLDASIREVAAWSQANPREILILDLRFLGSLATPGDLDRTARDLCPTTYARTARDPACRDALARRYGASGEGLGELRDRQLERLRTALAPVCAHAAGPGVAPTDLTFGALWAAGQRFLVAFDAAAADRDAFAADPGLAACLRSKPATIAEHWPWERMRDAVPGCDGGPDAAAEALRALTAWALEPGHGLDPSAVAQRTTLQLSQTHFTPSDATFAAAGSPGCADSLRAWQRGVTATLEVPDRERGCLSGAWPAAAWEQAGGRPNIVETDFVDGFRDPLGREDPYLFTGTLAAISWGRLHGAAPWELRRGPWAYAPAPSGPGCDELAGSAPPTP